MKHLSAGQGGGKIEIVCRSSVRLSKTELFLALDTKSTSRMSSGWHVFQHSNSSLHRSNNYLDNHMPPVLNSNFRLSVK